MRGEEPGRSNGDATASVSSSGAVLRTQPTVPEKENVSITDDPAGARRRNAPAIAAREHGGVMILAVAYADR